MCVTVPLLRVAHSLTDIKKLPEDAFPFRAVRDKLRFHLQQV